MKIKGDFCILLQSLLCVCLLFLCFINISNAEQKQKTNQEFNIRIAVEEVRIDAVVLNGKGQQVTDLTANDFEIYQDGRKQQVLSCKYVIDQMKQFDHPSIPIPGAQNKKAAPLPPIPSPAPARNEIRRTIVFIIDDISMSFEQINWARKSLMYFIQKQMQPGDAVAILRTSYGNSALQMFLTDRRELNSRIDAVAHWGPATGRELSEDNLYSILEGQIAAIRYCARALENMPGRKTIIFMTSQTVIPDYSSKSGVNYLKMYMPKINRLSDIALRAGVVIHFMDIRQLEVEPTTRRRQTFDLVSAQDAMVASFRTSLYTEKAQLRNPLPQKTGGLIVENTNFAMAGIGKLNDALKGYYLLSYAPPPNTFGDKQNEGYRKIKVKLKRGGAEVHTRDGFVGAIQAANEAAPAANPLRDALFSPFQYHDLNINLSSGCLYDAKEGYLLRSWLHLNANNLEIVDKKEEGHFISLETVALTLDSNGAIQDSSLAKYDLRVKEENLAWIKDHGIKFSLLLPIKKPGNYSLRIAAKDLTSGKVGSAYEFVAIPDISRGRLAISNLFVIDNEDDAAWVRSGVAKEKIQNWLMPSLARDERRSPALRSYMPGDSLEYMAVVYNANRREKPPDLESQFVLYRDGNEFLRGKPQKIDLTGVSDLSKIPIRIKMLLRNALEKGDYVLQLLVKDKQQNRLVAQALSFQIESK